MSTGAELATAVRRWLDTLDGAGRERATFAFDDPGRMVWQFTPGERAGLPLRDMAPDQREAAMAMVRAALSERGTREVSAIIALETVLGELERSGGRVGGPRRDPALYWFSVFGEPASDGGDPWMWRIGGHHVAIHLTLADGQVVGSSPSFLGANPAVIPSGPRTGERTLTGEETLARELVGAMTSAERAVAIVDPVAPPEILTLNAAHADVRDVPRGLRHADMAPAAQTGLERLIRHYLDRAPEDVADAAWRTAIAEDLPDTTFAWAGSTEPGHGHYYAVRGERLLIEYDNTQNGANHIHAVWRDLANDWGDDTLAAHYRASHAPARDRPGGADA